MASVRQRGTCAELAVRQCLRRLKYRFRCNRQDLPGSPDLLLPKESIAVFVHGCFWHRHRCRYATLPKTNQEFWLKKFADNKSRDRQVQRDLRKMDWKVLVVWECWTRQSGFDERVSALIGKISRAAVLRS
jgi:DNA mismatch endonuclease (patch repair protein)